MLICFAGNALASLWQCNILVTGNRHKKKLSFSWRLEQCTKLMLSAPIQGTSTSILVAFPLSRAAQAGFLIHAHLGDTWRTCAHNHDQPLFRLLCHMATSHLPNMHWQLHLRKSLPACTVRGKGQEPTQDSDLDFHVRHMLGLHHSPASVDHKLQVLWKTQSLKFVLVFFSQFHITMWACCLRRGDVFLFFLSCVVDSRDPLFRTSFPLLRTLGITDGGRLLERSPENNLASPSWKHRGCAPARWPWSKKLALPVLVRAYSNTMTVHYGNCPNFLASRQ